MPKEPKTAKSEPVEGPLTTTAKAIGTVAGKIASIAGVGGDAPVRPQTESAKPAKLAKKNKHRLPRRQKKAMMKAASTVTS